jgi:SAP domain
MYFDPANTSNFPSSTTGMSHYRYQQILKGLNATTNRPPQVLVVCGSTGRTVGDDFLGVGVWKPPMAHNADMATAMAILRRSCAEIAFVPGTTDIGLDDDLLRLRSRRVVLEGYSQINNPNKGLGVIHHGAVSNCTSLYCGGHVASRRESTIDCVKILLLALSGASIESQISLNRTKFFWDRGYGGVEGEVNSFAIAKGAVLVGTSKRMKSFPFTFDQHPGPSRRLIQEKGTMAAYWAVRGTAGNKQFALANRSGLGRVVLMHTTDEALGPGRYTLITQRGENAKIKFWSDMDPVMQYIDTVVMLTESQRTPEWFLLRKFRITGTSAYAVLKVLARNTGVGDENINAVLRILSLQRTHVDEPVVDEVVYTHERLSEMVVSDLRVICRNKNLPVSGTKAVLIQRILAGAHDEGNQPPQDESTTVMSALMKTWFMAPFKSKACREGTLNEPFIFSHFPLFISEKSVACLASVSRVMKIESIHEFGLLCHPYQDLAAFSPDAIAGVLEELPSGPTRYVALVEMKSKCTQATLTEEYKLIAEFGAYQEINADEDPELFKVSIPEASYRCQLLHGMASGALNHAFYVVASLRKIIRVVHVQVGSLIREQYVSVITNLGRQHLSWIAEGAVPAMAFEAGSHAVDHHSVQCTLDLWRAICRLILEQGKPLPAGRHLIPEVVATWNRGKGPIDVYSRFQKNCKSAHSHLGPVGAIWLRLIMTCVYNAYHAHNLSRTVTYLMSEECKSFKDFQKRRARQLSFRQFCRELANDLQLEVVPPSIHESGSDDDDTGIMRSTDRGDRTSSVVITYNKREAYFTKPHLIERRMNRRVLHQPSSVQRQSSCVWCCRIDHSTGQRHTRHGRKTTWMCSMCDVPLCKRPRFNGQSCFLLFHEAETLFDPCCADAQHMEVSVRSHGNRHVLSSRRRTTDVSAGTAEGQMVPPSASRTNDMSIQTAEGPMVPPFASRNDNDDDDYIPGNSSDDDDDRSSCERPASRRRTCSAITIPERRTRRSRLM